MQKYTDDTTNVGCTGVEEDYGDMIQRHLLLNTKTREMVVDFRRTRTNPELVVIEADTYKCLRVQLDDGTGLD